METNTFFTLNETEDQVFFGFYPEIDPPTFVPLTAVEHRIWFGFLPELEEVPTEAITEELPAIEVPETPSAPARFLYWLQNAAAVALLFATVVVILSTGN